MNILLGWSSIITQTITNCFHFCANVVDIKNSKLPKIVLTLHTEVIGFYHVDLEICVGQPSILTTDVI